MEAAGGELPGAVVVTGGGSGIGRAAVLASAARGAGVAVLDVNQDAARAVAAEAAKAGAPEAVGVACDVRDEASVAAAVASAAERLGPVRGLVACAGIDLGGEVHEMPLDRWNDVLATNLTGMFLTCKHVIARMLEQGDGGSVVCASSPWGQVSSPGGAAAYSASKGGISALVRSMALDYAGRSVRVNAIVPGATETPLMWGNVPDDEKAEMRALVRSQLVMGRLAEPAEIAEAIVWLLSEQASYVTGSQLVVDGGLLARASIAL